MVLKSVRFLLVVAMVGSILLSLRKPEVAASQASAPEDFEDIAILVDGSLEAPTAFDTVFCKLADYYGVHCKIIDLLSVELSLEDLLDENGDIFPLIVISADALPQMRGAEIIALRNIVRDYETNLLVSKLKPWSNLSVLSALTEGNILDVTRVEDTFREWTVTQQLPAISREFTGVTIDPDTNEPPSDSSILVRRLSNVISYPLITAMDDEGQPYSTLVMLPRENGRIFIEAGETFFDAPLRELYTYPGRFSQIIPLMFIIRFALKDEVWHSTENYANLTLDAAALEAQFRLLNYNSLLTEMTEHNFHTTIALPPVMATESDTVVISLFLQHPERYSLVQFGNNIDGYEFYYYDLPEELRTTDTSFRARPYYEQVNAIREGLGRLATHQYSTGIPYGHVMIFPVGISPLPTLQLLKQYGYLATIGDQDAPLGEVAPEDDWEFNMHPSIMEFGSFPIIQREIYVRTYVEDQFQDYVQAAIYDLFLDKPALFWSHPYHGELFTTGMQEFSPIADEVNELCCDDIQWRSLEQILMNLRMERQNDDGSTSIQMYTNLLHLTNDGHEAQTYYLYKTEDESLPIRSVTVNDVEVDYEIVRGELQLSLDLDSGETAIIKVTYAAG